MKQEEIKTKLKSLKRESKELVEFIMKLVETEKAIRLVFILDGYENELKLAKKEFYNKISSSESIIETFELNEYQRIVDRILSKKTRE